MVSADYPKHRHDPFLAEFENQLEKGNRKELFNQPVSWLKWKSSVLYRTEKRY